jgi:hypothetical protein
MFDTNIFDVNIFDNIVTDRPIFDSARDGASIGGTPTSSVYTNSKMDAVLSLLSTVGVKGILLLQNNCPWPGYLRSSTWVNDWLSVAQHYKGDSRVAASTITYPTCWVIGFNYNSVSDWYNELKTYDILSKGNIIFDVLHPYYFDIPSYDNYMTPVQKADWYRDNYLLPAINLFGAQNCWIGETFGWPAFQGGNYNNQLAFELEMIKALVDNRVGFQMWCYFTYYYYNHVQLEHDILARSEYYTKYC